ncbi:hypothetical protein [Kordiimonas aestuarii]|uniref:hypothetical protein n=1 Tax=Kordiimonas aestuarii TaxID=1005925 RepID=UPI0021D3C406|nr:hypothetical protein [Kordiimonas aestuarii]
MQIFIILCQLVAGVVARAFDAAPKASASTASPVAALKGVAARFFYTRPALKRGALVLALQLVVLLPLSFFALKGGQGIVPLALTLFMFIWCAFLFGLFLGMAAERAATDWDDVFALPPLNAFLFWRWHALERRRFMAVAGALLLGLYITAQFGWTP